jgi:hypothetical protein
MVFFALLKAEDEIVGGMPLILRCNLYPLAMQFLGVLFFLLL